MKKRVALLCAVSSLFFAPFVNADDSRVASGSGSGSGSGTESGTESGSGSDYGRKLRERWAASFAGELDAIDFRFSNTVVRGSDHDATGVGFTVGSTAWITWSSGLVQAHGDYELAIGGGGNGLEGAVATNQLIGLRIPITNEVGPFLRVGGGGEFRGNDSYLLSHLDLPKGQVGFNYVRQSVSFEAGLEGAIALGGRFVTGDDSRRILDGAPTWGGFVQAQAWPIVLRGEYRTFVQNHDPPSVEEWVARACAAFPIFESGAAAPFTFCFDGRWMNGGVFVPGSQVANESRVSMIGFSIGLGAVMGENFEGRAAAKKETTPPKKEDSPSGLDATDMRRLTSEAMSHFGGSRAMQDLLAVHPTPVAVVMPFTSNTTPPLSQEALAAARAAVENTLLELQATTLANHADVDRLVAQAGGAAENPQAIARALKARYAFYGFVAPRTEQIQDAQSTSYTLTIRAMDVDANTVVWQQTADITKVVQGK